MKKNKKIPTIYYRSIVNFILKKHHISMVRGKNKVMQMSGYADIDRWLGQLNGFQAPQTPHPDFPDVEIGMLRGISLLSAN